VTADRPPVRPAVSYLKLPRDGRPYLAGSKCGNCATVYVGERRVCARCLARGRMEAVQLSERGRLYTYTIVHRSFPGVPTPFVAAVVDLDGGGTVHGTLVDVVPDPAHLPFDLPVRIVYRDTGQRDADGAAFIAPFFVPAESVAGDDL
jgi:uncharacterized OB-fold protein